MRVARRANDRVPPGAGRVPTKGVRASPVIADILALQRLAGNRAVSSIMVQRRAGKLPTGSDLAAVGPALPKVGDARYAAVLSDVSRYHALPAEDYGKQIDVLARTIPAKIKAWEAANGKVTQAEGTESRRGVSRTNLRRRALKRVADALPVENPLVRDQGYRKATEEHEADRQRLLELLAEAKTETFDVRLQNSFEWIEQGRAKLYAVTPTGDAFARLKANGKDPEQFQSYFPRAVGGAGDVRDAPVAYRKNNLKDDTHVTLDQGPRTRGWNASGAIAIVSPRTRDKESIFSTLRHEVQHDADKNAGRDAQRGVRKAAELVDAAKPGPKREDAEKKLDAEACLQLYKTEYRAYSYQAGSELAGKFGRLDNSNQNRTRKGYKFSERQLAIFEHIYEDYDHTRRHWDADSVLVDGKKFRQAVSDYWHPGDEGANPMNSVRVDDFWERLDACGSKRAETVREKANVTHNPLRALDIRPVKVKAQDLTTSTVKSVLEAIDNLNPEEARSILRDSPATMAKIDAHLAGDAKAKVLEQLDATARSAPTTSPSLFD